MPIELRILTGARANQTRSFDQSEIAIGRHPMSDLQFDATQDLDVSARHGTIRFADGQYLLADDQSTNGTFVNGERLPDGGTHPLHDGDVIAFGAHGPTVAVHIPGNVAATVQRASHAVAAPPLEHPTAGVPAAPRRPTTERVAIAVAEQTRGLRIAVAGVVIVLGGIAAATFWASRRTTAAKDAEIQRLLAANEQESQTFQAQLQGMSDTAVRNDYQRRIDSLMNAARQARGNDTRSAQQALQRTHQIQQQLTDMGLPAVRDANNPAIVLITAEIPGHTDAFEATGFSVSSGGLIVTNRHVVMDSAGAKANGIVVKFADTRDWRHAHLVKVASGANVDLALVQVDEPGPYPAVRGVANTVDTPVGGAIATLGFPDGSALPMEGSGSDFTAKTTLTTGTVSKLIPDLLQIDAFAGHGSSGSPVLDGKGQVIGVVWGGPTDAAGRIVYAVPAERISELLRGVK